MHDDDNVDDDDDDDSINIYATNNPKINDIIAVNINR